MAHKDRRNPTFLLGTPSCSNPHPLTSWRLSLLPSGDLAGCTGPGVVRHRSGLCVETLPSGARTIVSVKVPRLIQNLTADPACLARRWRGRFAYSRRNAFISGVASEVSI